MTDQIVTALIGTGAPYGIFSAFLIWDRIQASKLAEKRIEADKALAVSMTMLAERIK